MNNFVPNAVVPAAMYVRALYDYDADDRTSLSFRQGDIIQVITQLESGWWDGVIHGVRGWFPSNYCAVITGMETPHGATLSMSDQGADSEPEEYHVAAGTAVSASSPKFDGIESKLHLDTDVVQEEAAFWIPQATPDGRLFYFNTLTGVSTMELPLETPTSATGPRSANTVSETRPTAELLSGGIERDEPHTDTEPESAAQRSYLSNGLSPTTSTAPRFVTDTRSRDASSSYPTIHHSNTPAITAFGTNALGLVTNGIASQSLFSDTALAYPSWDSLVQDMETSTQHYKLAIENGERAEFVRRAEEISDHLRFLLAAGSATTDNHSGNPSIISTNKSLYPHFREMMSSFSKLVLSSHFAAADFTSADSYTKCLQEADGLLHGVQGFVEIARQQRGEEIQRLLPGFLTGTRSGGHWRNQGLNIRDASLNLPLLPRDEGDILAQPNTPLNATLLERMEDLKKLILASIRRLDEQAVLHDDLITAAKHRQLGDNICREAGKVLEICRPYIATIETINLASFGNDMNTAQLEDFATHKQRFYDSTSEVVVSSQAVAAPLADEWSSDRGMSMEERLQQVKSCARELDRATSQLHYSVSFLAEIVPADAVRASMESRRPGQDGRSGYQEVLRSRGINTNVGTPRSLSVASEGMSPAQSAKVHRFFGEIPVPIAQVATNETLLEETSPFLGLDHENELAYDIRVAPPQLRGGTLVGLVEQLTRHDKLDSPFNNTFLLTYRSFTSAVELFEMLNKRWCIQPPSGLPAADMQKWIDKKQKPIRFRVVNILKSWFDNYWMEGTEEAAQQLMQRVFTFAKETVASTSTPGAGPLMTAIEQRMRGQDASSKRMVLTHSGSMPAAIVPKNIKKLKFLDIDTLEFARQLTIIESRLYAKIKPTECLNKTWQKKLEDGEADPAANVKALILHSNQLTNWVAQMILTQADVKRRQIVIKHFVSIADKCRGLNNFSTLTSIISALGTAPIHRLGRTWSQVNQKTMVSLEQMRTLMGSTKNFTEYRETLHRANPPCIPFFGVYLTDLVFIEDGIPSIIKKTNLINFAKRAKTAEVIRDIQQYQNVPYQLQPVMELQDYILKNMQSAGDVHEMYERSLQVEPREREDEKIARLLSESGFL